MKKGKLVQFIINGKVVEQVNGNEVNFDDIENLKVSIAFIQCVAFGDVEVVSVDAMFPELSETMSIRNDGSLLLKNKRSPNPKIITGIRPAMDTTKEELFAEFLDLIYKKDYDNAIIFN